MLSTDGYAFLNINHPLCSWATYRGCLVSSAAASDEPGFVSVWMATMLYVENNGALSREIEIDRVRQAKYPDKISRLSGLYCFLDLESAERAANLWGSSGRNHFRPEYLAELNLSEATGRDRLDSNWITYAPVDSSGAITETDWIDHHWQGEPSPGKDPIWETLLEGRALVLGTNLRDEAYKIIKKNFPDSLCLLEIARQAAWVGSDMGNIAAQLFEDGDEWGLRFLFDMREANDQDFLAKLDRLKKEDHPINWADMRPHLEEGTFGKVPDMGPYEFMRPK